MIKQLLMGGVLAALVGTAGLVLAQGGGGGGGSGGRFGGRGGLGGRFGGGATGSDPSRLIYINGDPYGQEPDGRLFMWPRRPTDLSDRGGVPVWDYDPHYKGNLFTFARIKYYSYRYSDSWATDYPMSDLNFSCRLQEQTSFKVNPYPVVLTFDDPNLFNYPFIYMVEVATLEFQEGDIAPLRRYLLNGGFLMVDNFFGAFAWNSFRKQMERIFPDKQPVELDISHPIFHQVFDLKEKPQIPKITHWARAQQFPGSAMYPDDTGAHYWAYFDDKGRMMALVCHNTDLGNGWSRELSTTKMIGNITLRVGSESDPINAQYFHQYCEQLGYPMGMNIMVYVMTH